MTNLYINGTAVVLPSGFSIAVKQENAFFTKNGEYTYDIELSLQEPVNAKLYGFLNRLNVTERPATKRKAILVADNRVYLNGTEIITGWTDTTVSIQLVSGNSELNYFVGSDELISTLTGMPETDPSADGTISVDYAAKTYPDVDYNLMMVYDSVRDLDKNQWLFHKEYTENDEYFGYLTPADNIQPYDYIPQPFLCAYMREMLKALGFDLEYNAIEETPWKTMYIVHVNDTYKWCEMLPGWTAKEFLEQVETMFNGTFLIDFRNHKTSFLLNSSYLSKVRNVHLQNVVDTYTVESEDEEEGDPTNSTVKYKLPDTDYYKLRSLPSIVKETAKSKTVDEDLFDFFQKEVNQVTDTIFDYTEGKRKVIYISDTGNNTTIEFVDELASLVREKASSEIELELIPAEMALREYYIADSDPEAANFNDYYIPSAKSVDKVSEDVTLDTVHDMVANLTESKENKSEIYLAFYYGLNPVKINFLGIDKYPFAFVDKYYPTASWPVELPAGVPTFNLMDIGDAFYVNTYQVDRKNPVKITCYDNNVYPASSVFEIFNRRFLAKEIEYTIGPNGRSGPWTGTFYPADIPDTEVEQRWILADGRWRDEGVWLDEGRWLDDYTQTH